MRTPSSSVQNGRPGRERRPEPRAAFLIAGRSTSTNLALVAAWRRLGVEARVLPVEQAMLHARDGDVALVRVDVLPTLDGGEASLWGLRRLARQGVSLLNNAGSLLIAHDKLATALRLGQLGLPHPRTAHLGDDGKLPEIEFPVVVKPRFGSWGSDVVLCSGVDEFRRCLSCLRRRPWFRRHGVLVQELVPPRGYDLRLLVFGREVVDAVERVAGPGRVADEYRFGCPSASSG